VQTQINSEEDPDGFEIIMTLRSELVNHYLTVLITLASEDSHYHREFGLGIF
jgi:hypothetical protein